MHRTPASYDLICFSHLRWNFVFQRPNHLMKRCSSSRRVFFFEEPIAAGDGGAALNVSEVSPNLFVVAPRLATAQDPTECSRLALNELCSLYAIEQPIAWFYSPMALEFARDLASILTIYDCMDELSAFQGASPALGRLERELFARADLVFTGGRSLCRAKQSQHHAVYCFPSSVDVLHYARARSTSQEPADQAAIPHPRLGFFGVIDERMNLALIEAVAGARPDWHLVMIGPVVKIDPATLPRLPNIHYLGQKTYAELPEYLSGWDVALMPFALNASTRFISPTKTLEYLAGGKPVVSTSIADVVSPFAERDLVRVADAPEAFIDAIDATLKDGGLGDRASRVQEFLAGTSWAATWAQMASLISSLLERVRRESGPSKRLANERKVAS